MLFVTPYLARRSTAGIAAAAMTLGLVLAMPSAADAAVAVERIEGEGRFETGTAVTKDAFAPDDIDVVYLATGRGFPDALAAGAAAARNRGAVLLTEKDRLVETTADEIERLDPKRVVVVGGTTVLADDVLAAVEALDTDATVERIAGENRYETAGLIALDGFEPDDVNVVYLATGRNFPDALSGVPAAALDRAPILLTDPTTLPDATADAIEALKPIRVIVLGGTTAVSEDVETAAGALATSEKNPTTRIAGQSRVDTSVRVSQQFITAGTMYIATARNFPDALTGGPAAASVPGPVLLLDTGSPDLFTDSINAVAGRICTLRTRRVVLLGGQAALPIDTAARLTAATDDCAAEPFEAPDGEPIGFKPQFVGVSTRALVGYAPDKGGWLIDSVDSDEGNITFTDPALSPNGERVAYVLTIPLEGGNASERTSTLEVVDLLTGDGAANDVVVGVDVPDGESGCQLMFDVEWRPGTNDTIAYTCSGDAYLVTIGEEPELVGPANDILFSPDGSVLALVNSFAADDVPYIEGFNPDDVTAASTVLLSRPAGSDEIGGGVSQAAWSPDGSFIAALTTDPDEDPEGVSDFRERLFRVDIGTDALTVVYDAPDEEDTNAIELVGITSAQRMIVTLQSAIDFDNDEPDVPDDRTQELLSIDKDGDVKKLLDESNQDADALVRTGDVEGNLILVFSSSYGIVTMDGDGGNITPISSDISYGQQDLSKNP